MRFTRKQTGDVVVLELVGMTQFGDSRLVKEELEDIRKFSHKLVVDFASVEYVGSSVLGVLATEVKKNRELGGDVRLAGLNGGVKRLFTITRLDKVFSIYDNVADAIKDFPE